MISIIIPVFNQHDMTQECIYSILENTQDYELIIIDNGSNPPFKPPFTGMIETTLIHNDENKGFPVAVNQGIRAAKGDVIILLNNDVIVTPEWAGRLIKWLDNFSIVGPVTNYCAGLQNVTAPVYTSKESLYDVASQWSEEYAGLIQEVNFIIGFCMVFKKAIYDELGPFDESLWPCSGEELDFCLKARAAGHKIGIAQDVYIHHEGSQTFNDLVQAGQIVYEEICKRNDAHVAEKWGTDFWLHQAVIDDSIRLNLGCGEYHLQGFINIDRFANVNPDLLADVLYLPYQPGTIDEIYAGHLLEHLTFEEGQNALKYWYGLLKSGGVIGITVPDFDVLAKKHLADSTAASMREFNDMWIYSYVQDSLHRYCYNESLLIEIMKAAGFINLERLPVDHPYFTDSVDWQIGYKGVKP